MGNFRFAIMGAGLIARKFCDAVALTEGCVVAAAASKSMERARSLAREKDIPAAYDNYEQMLEAERPDCVYVSTTCDSHFDLAMLCARKGVAVLCEKAMFTSSAQADAFFSLAEKKNVFAMEALWSRFLPAVHRAKKWIAEGRIGQVALGEMNIGFVAPPETDNRYFNPALGGGAANDLTVYGLQILPWVLGRSITRARVEATAATTGVDATSIVLLSLEGVPAVVKSSLVAPANEGLILLGSQGRIVVPHAHYGSEAFLYSARGEELERFTDDVTQNGFTYEIREVMDCVAQGKRESAVVPWASTRACAAIFDQIHEALAQD